MKSFKLQSENTEILALRGKATMSNPLPKDALAAALKEFSAIANKPHMHPRWAQNFLWKVLGFTNEYTLSYQMTGVETRPLILVKHGKTELFGLETGRPPVLRQKSLPFKMLFTGTDWRLYDVKERPLLISFAEMSNPDELATMHSSQVHLWESLAAEARLCDTETVANKLLSQTMLELLRKELGTDLSDAILRQRVQEIITGATPLKKVG
jgi:hypothetical protein